MTIYNFCDGSYKVTEAIPGKEDSQADLLVIFKAGNYFSQLFGCSTVNFGLPTFSSFLVFPEDHWEPHYRPVMKSTQNFGLRRWGGKGILQILQSELNFIIS